MVGPRPAGDGALITADLHTADVDRFRNLVERHLGLRFGDDTAHHLERVLVRRLEAAGLGAEQYLDQLERNPHAEIPVLAGELTIGETYFLRHVEQFHALVRTVVPERLAGQRKTGRAGLQVLSAGCATGEETYSLAIALRESAVAPAETSVLGVDVNPVALEKAREGRYSPWSMRTIPATVRRAWFTTEADEEVVDPQLRAQVRFERRNFAIDDPGLWTPERFDVVFCRNVLMYFSTELMTTVIGRIARALAPGGYLFLGSAETLRSITDDFELRQSDGAFYYRKPDDARSFTAHRPVPAETGLRPGRSSGTPEPPAPPAPSPPIDLSRVLGLIAVERFAEALEALDSATSPGSGDPRALVVRASLQIAVGNPSGAEHTAYQLIGGPGHPGTARQPDGASGRDVTAAAHLMLSMCAAGARDLPTATDHCRAALRSDPGHALARMHLAQLLAGAGNPAAARAEYAEAARRLPHAPEFDVLLFGGGFDRSGLISVCEAQSVKPK